MKKLFIATTMMCLSATVSAQSSVIEGVVEKAEVITTEVGKDGKPLLGAAVGVGLGSLIGGGSGNTAAKVAGGLLGASRQANKKKQMYYGWRYIIKAADQLHVVDTWCPSANTQCPGIVGGKEVYVINGKEVAVK